MKKNVLLLLAALATTLVMAGCQLNSRPDFAIGIAATAHGKVVASVATATAGTDVTLTVTPDSGYAYKATTIPGVTAVKSTSVEPSTGVATVVFTMPSDNALVTVTYDTAYTISSVASAGGAVKSNYASASAGTSVTLTVTPATGYAYKSIAITGVSSLTSATVAASGVATVVFVMPSQAAVVTVTYDTAYSITGVSVAGGTVTADHAYAASGTTIKLTVTPTSGYYLTALTVNGTAVTVTSNSASFTMPAAAVTLAATFAVVPATLFTISTSVTGTGGTLTADKSSAQVGALITLTVTPATGYALKTLTVNGTAQTVVGGQTTYTFTMGAANATVVATFGIPEVYSSTSPLTLATNTWTGGGNYQGLLDLSASSTTAASGDYFTLILSGTSNVAIPATASLQMVLVDTTGGGWTVISGYKVIATTDIAANTAFSFVVPFPTTAAGALGKLSVMCNGTTWTAGGAASSPTLTVTKLKLIKGNFTTDPTP